MSGFAALMALSASQTKESQSAVQAALVQRQRKEEIRRKQQEEQERKEHEMEVQRRLKHFENEKKERERQQRLEQERKEMEQILRRREEAQRDALRYGPKKSKVQSGGDSPKWPTSNIHTREDARARESDDNDSVGTKALTREELRRQKELARMRREYNTQKRSSAGGGYHRASRRLPGGALDVMASSPSPSPDVGASSQSVKERIASIPNALTKLNVNKRDTRTIDEILQDRAKAKGEILSGDQAKEFSDWFGNSKKKDPSKRPTPQPALSSPGSGASTPVPRPPPNSKCLWQQLELFCHSHPLF
jgi:protein SPT2